MKIELKEITVGELSKGYEDNAEAGVVGFDGKLDIRPPYQREFIYKDKQRDAVINTVTKDFPLNVMYWAVRDDGNFEIINARNINKESITDLSEFSSGLLKKVIEKKEPILYHDVMKAKLHKLLGEIKSACPEAVGKCCVDTSPMMDKYWATQAGMSHLSLSVNVSSHQFSQADLVEQVGCRLRRHGLRGRTVQLKVRFADFSITKEAKSAPSSVPAAAE
jgi:hypothetical protein